MARYYEETALIEFVKRYTPHINGETTMQCVERAIRNAPTADVVPKSEYDAVVSAVDNSTQEFLKLHDDYQEAKREVERLQKERDEYKKHVDNDIIYVHRIKAEVAREIFEEMWKLVTKIRYDADYTIFDMQRDFAELKKKYTENENG